MKKLLLSILLTLLPLLAYSSIEGIYQVQPESYRISSQTKTYGKPFEIMIYNNGDGTYYVDDLLGGWYSQREGYGRNYSMTGNIEISEDGTVSLKDSYIKGWDEGVTSLTGTFDLTNSTFKIEVAYARLYFVQTWIKIGDIDYGGDSDIEKNGIYYKLNSQEKKAAVAINPNFYRGNLIIPEKIEHEGVEYDVTAIADSAFYLCRNLLSLEMPNSITSIGVSAFNECENLSSINIPNSITDIGKFAFYLCSKITSLDIPNHTINFGDAAFAGCSSLTSIVLPDQLERIGNNVFSGCSALTSIILPDNVTSIGDGAFSACTNLATISFPNVLTYIGDNAFAGCNSLPSLSLPNSLRVIGVGAFEYCNFTSIEIPNGLTIIGSRAFSENYDLSYVNIPPSLVEIGDHCFDQNNLTIDISDVSAWCKVKINSEIGCASYKLYFNGQCR